MEGSFQPNRKYTQGLPSLTISLPEMGAITQDEVFEIREKEASGKGSLLKEGTQVRKAPLNFKVTLQGAALSM